MEDKIVEVPKDVVMNMFLKSMNNYDELDMEYNLDFRVVVKDTKTLLKILSHLEDDGTIRISL